MVSSKIKVKKRIKVVYDGPFDKEVDKAIMDCMEGIGAEWYAQGYDFTKNERDICFDLEIPIDVSIKVNEKGSVTAVVEFKED